MVLRNGEVVARQPGAAPAPALRAWLDEALAKPGNPEKSAQDTDRKA
jgi:thioredoxin 2